MDLVELSKAAHLIGSKLRARTSWPARIKVSSRGETRRAARSAFWLGFISLVSGEPAQASGWLSRAERLLDDQPDCVEKGYLSCRWAIVRSTGAMPKGHIGHSSRLLGLASASVIPIF